MTPYPRKLLPFVCFGAPSCHIPPYGYYTIERVYTPLCQQVQLLTLPHYIKKIIKLKVRTKTLNKTSGHIDPKSYFLKYLQHDYTTVLYSFTKLFNTKNNICGLFFAYICIGMHNAISNFRITSYFANNFFIIYAVRI